MKSVLDDKSPHSSRLQYLEVRKTPASLHFLPNSSGTNLAMRQPGGNHCPITEEAFDGGYRILPSGRSTPAMSTGVAHGTMSRPSRAQGESVGRGLPAGRPHPRCDHFKAIARFAYNLLRDLF